MTSRSVSLCAILVLLAPPTAALASDTGCRSGAERAGRIATSGDMTLDGVRVVRVQDSSGDIVIDRVAGNVCIDRDSSGDIAASAVGGNVELLANGSGQRRITDVKGTVQVPGRPAAQRTQARSRSIIVPACAR